MIQKLFVYLIPAVGNKNSFILFSKISLKGFTRLAHFEDQFHQIIVELFDLNTIPQKILSKAPLKGFLIARSRTENQSVAFFGNKCVHN
jgi:hypothetical protein